MIDVFKDKLLSPAELAELVPAVGGWRPDADQIRRWIRIGIGGVKLEAVKVGPRFATTLEAFRTFVRVTSGQPTPEEFVPSEADKLADQQLAGMGL